MRFPNWKLILLFGDFAGALLAFSLAAHLVHPLRTDPMIAWLIATALALYFSGMYEREVVGDPSMLIARLVSTLLMAAGIAGVMVLAMPSTRLGRTVAATYIAILFVTLAGWRRLHDTFIKARMPRTRIVVIGAGRAGQELVRTVAGSAEYVLAGVYDDDPAKWGTPTAGLNVRGPAAAIMSSAGASPEIVAVAITHEKSPELLQTLIECRKRGSRVMDMARCYEDITGKLPVEHLSNVWLAMWSDIMPIRGNVSAKGKRFVDVVGSALLLAVLGIPTAIGGLAVRLTSPGSMFYRQRRVGKDGRTFDVVKLRSMRMDAELNGAVWATKNDPRVTPAGRFLRSTRLDEVPQLWNVFKGDMSLVGPRPERPEMVNTLEHVIPYYQLRHLVRPGLTGWAQVSYPYGATIDDARHKLEFDLYYIRHFGLIFDLRILLKTVHVVLFGKGSR